VSNLVALYERWNKPEKAEPLLRRQLDFVAEMAGADSTQAAARMAPLAQNLLAQKKSAEAEKLLRDSLRIREKAQPDEWTTFNTKSLLGEALLAEKKLADAERLLVQGYEGMKQREAKIPPPFRVVRLKESLERLVALYDATDKKKAAKYRNELDALTIAAKEPAKK
jgi:eukaryotic-like serine/threonine-protein kinase